MSDVMRRLASRWLYREPGAADLPAGRRRTNSRGPAGLAERYSSRVASAAKPNRRPPVAWRTTRTASPCSRGRMSVPA